MEEENSNPDQPMDLLHDGEVFEFEEVEELMDLQQNEEEIQQNQQLEEWKPSTGFSNRAKIIEILKNLHSPEINIYSHSSKEFTGLLKGESGDGFLIELVQLSPNCIELIDAWKIHQNKPGLFHILALLAAILDHPAGKSKNNNLIRKNLDNLARSIMNSKIDDIYSELNAKESKRQSAGLNLLASIIKRGIGLASELAKNFNFKLPIISKLSGIRKKSHRDSKTKEIKRYTRHAFINFAMSFVESANPRLLRWIIQQKELFSGVLRGISTDDSETVIYVLALFRDKILNGEFLIPPGLRSVLFGSATLEQLSFISGNSEAGPAADVAHQVLLTVCVNPKNGLMPGLGLKGNEKRLFDLMKKLKATESKNHKELVLEICGRNVSLCANYLDEFPYHLEPRPSPSWFSAISLLADIISSLDENTLISSLSSFSQYDKLNLILKCITPQICSRLILNKGLLHSDELVRHGALRTVLESLKILCGLIRATNCVASENEKLVCYIQDEVRANLPDPQVLLKLLSNKSSNKEIVKISGGKLKRCAESAEPFEVVNKKVKVGESGNDDDIMIGGINLGESEMSNIMEKEGPKCKSDKLETVCEIWGLNGEELFMDEPVEMENIFRSKLLDVLTFYLRSLPGSFEGSFDFIKILPTDPSNLSKFELSSLLSLLLEFISPSSNSEKIPDSIYKHLQPLLNILLNSKENNTREKAKLLVRAAMLSTGAFDYNNWEINCWLVFIPGYFKNKNSDKKDKFNEIQISNVVVSFLCDSISTVGNNLFKYLDQMRKFVTGDKKPDFSPLVLCILQKCLRLLDSDSGSFKLHERTIISFYVCNSLSLILQSQVESSSLAGLINSVLSEKFKEYSSKELDKKLSLSEWKPLKNLLFLSENTLNRNYQNLFSLSKTVNPKKPKNNNKSFSNEMITTEDVICTKTEDIIANFPLILTTEREDFSLDFPFLASLLFLERDTLSKIANKCPELFHSGLKMTRGKTVNTDNEAGLFAKYLLEAPFHVLFSSLVGSGRCTELINSVEIMDLIKSKLSEGSLHELVLYLRFLLFWGFHALSAYISNPKSDGTEEILNLSFSLVEFVFDKITVLTSNCDEIQDSVDFLFEHPLITELLFCSLETGDLQLNGGLDEFKVFSEENLPLVNWCLLRFLTKLYRFLVNRGNKSDLNAPKLVLEKILSLFREKFKACIENENLGNLIPIYYIFRELMQFIPLSDLFNLSYSIFYLLETKYARSGYKSESALISAFICLKIADISMEILFKPDPKTNPFCEIKKESFDPIIFQKVYYQIHTCAITLNLEFGDEFIFKANERIYSYRYISCDLCLCILCSNIFTDTPLNLVNYCVYPTSKIKTKILELTFQASPNHLDHFGNLFLGLVKKDQSLLNQLNATDVFSEGDLVNLLPVALIYVNEIGLEKVKEIPALYSEILLKGLSNWKDFTSNFTEKYEKFDLNENASFEDFCGYFSKTLLGKAVCMLGYFVSLNEEIPKKQRFKILDSVFPESDEILDLDLNSIEFESSNNEEIMRLIDKIYSKVSVAKLLLSDKMESSKKANKFKQRFVAILINSLDRIVKNNPKKSNLEHFILQTIVEFISENQSYLIQLKSLPFLSTFIKSCFIHRFEDPITLRAIRCILISLSEGKFSANEILELLLGHSQFISSITNDSSNPYQFSLLQPVPSIFKSLNVSLSQNGPHKSQKGKIELIKLLRVIYHLIKTQDGEELLTEESKELLFLLLSIYGATNGGLDLEIFNLMKQIESHVGANWEGIAEMDYLFGNGVLKIREEMRSEIFNENGEIEERRKFHFRENISIDSRICVQTVLGFCYDRNLYIKMFDIQNIIQEKFNDDNQGSRTDTVQAYDTEYILQFGINSILNGYIEPIEYCKLGLLAVTFMSISSSDSGTRKLAYESLFRFKSSLENSGKSKEKLQIKLLLTYLQNGISEEWQQIPSLISVFLSEASFALLDSSKPQFFTVSKFLMHNLSANLKSVPLFNSLFQNSTIHFKNDRIWILQLLCAGLNLDDDAKIYLKNNILEHLMSLYSSATSDSESRLLILKIVKKAVKLTDLSNHLMKECGLLSWLSSVLSLHGELFYTDNSSSQNMDLVLEVINYILSSKEVSEFLQETGLEQLSQISSYLFKFLTRDINSLSKSIPLINSMLQIIISTLKLSQKRKIYQPHFTISLHGLYKLYQSIDIILMNKLELDQTLELVLDLILMSSPIPVFSHKDKLIFVDIIKWAISASLRLLDKNKTLIQEKQGKESLISKILRWIAASIIIGRISNQRINSTENVHENRINIKTLNSLLDSLSGGVDCDLGEESGLNEKIGAIILYLKQIVGKNNEGINNNSILLAVYILLLDSSTQSVKEYMRKNCDKIKEFCSKINCPAETNSSWRWSYYDAWKDLNLEQNEMEKREEEEASTRLLVIFSNLVK